MITSNTMHASEMERLYKLLLKAQRIQADFAKSKVTLAEKLEEQAKTRKIEECFRVVRANYYAYQDGEPSTTSLVPA